ncbi:MAG: flagellar protein [Lachnospiraceae bacterium]|nr:flagellar protein [Lachnospiraceae bacterium]
MDVRNCKSCGKLFNYLSGPPLCPNCMKALDEKFEQVKEYIYDHPRVDMQEVSEVFEVSIPQIKQWIREERLAFAEDSVIGLECERCGATIRTGRFCKSCKDKMARGLSELYPEEKPVEKLKDPRENPRMRFLNNEFKE